MKSTINKILITSMVFVLSGLLLADPVNPVGSGRVPPSSSRGSGLRRSPNPINASGNNLVTGNVAGDKYFRGTVPYRSTTSFGGVNSSSSLDNFRRRSAGSSGYNYGTGRYKPYYSPSRSVTIMRPGRSAVFKAPGIDFSGRTARGTVATDAIPKISSVNPELQLFSNQVRPIQLSSREMRRVIETDLRSRAENLPIDATGVRAKIQKVDPDFAKIEKQVDALKTAIKDRRQADLDQITPEDAKKPEQAVEPSETERLVAKVSRGEQLDVYEQMKMEIAGLDQMVKAKREIAKAEISTDAESEESAESEDAEDSIRPEKIVVEAKTHKTLAAYKDDKFNKHLRLAEAYLKEGKFYRASSAYSLAELYKPGDPIVYMGKSQALFAAGEYMSSAYYLSEAIRVFPEIVKIKMDLAAIVGDRDVLESRASDVEELLKEFNNVELKFLLSYVYYQTGRLERAKELIDAAYEANPDMEVIKVIRAAIDEALN